MLAVVGMIIGLALALWVGAAVDAGVIGTSLLAVLFGIGGVAIGDNFDEASGR